jgi:hypothetical protein
VFSGVADFAFLVPLDSTSSSPFFLLAGLLLLSHLWSFVKRNATDKTETPTLVMVFWSKKAWAKFVELEEISSAMDNTGKPFFKV